MIAAPTTRSRQCSTSFRCLAWPDATVPPGGCAAPPAAPGPGNAPLRSAASPGPMPPSRRAAAPLLRRHPVPAMLHFVPLPRLARCHRPAGRLRRSSGGTRSRQCSTSFRCLAWPDATVPPGGCAAPPAAPGPGNAPLRSAASPGPMPPSRRAAAPLLRRHPVPAMLHFVPLPRLARCHRPAGRLRRSSGGTRSRQCSTSFRCLAWPDATVPPGGCAAPPAAPGPGNAPLRSAASPGPMPPSRRAAAPLLRRHPVPAMLHFVPLPRLARCHRPAGRLRRSSGGTRSRQMRSGSGPGARRLGGGARPQIWRVSPASGPRTPPLAVVGPARFIRRPPPNTCLSGEIFKYRRSMVREDERGPTKRAQTKRGFATVTQDTIRIPTDLLPADGRFGSGPSKVRPESVAALSGVSSTYMGTSHRRAGVRSMVGRVREGLRELFLLPEGYEIVLGIGGATVFWDAMAFGLIEEQSQHVVCGEFSAKCAAAATAAPHLKEPEIIESEAGSAPRAQSSDGVDVYALIQNETSTGVAPELGRPGEGLVAIDATSGAGGMLVVPEEFDAYYFSPQKCFASDGGLWLAACSPVAIERIERVATSGRSIPPSLDLKG